jgi:ParB family chromosome partitioning protein
LILDLGLTQDEISKRVGKDRTTIANALRLLKLSKEVREKIVSSELSVGHARCLITVEDKELQNQLMNEILQKGLSVRQVEALVKKFRESGEKSVESVTTQSVAEDAVYEDIKRRLQEKLSAKVDIKTQSSGKGQFILYFSTKDEFNSLLAKIEG